MPVPLLWLLIAALVATATASPTVHQATGKLRLELSLSKAAYVPGEPVEASLTLRHEGDGPGRIQFTSAQRFDVLIRRGGALVWRWSDDKAFAQVIQEVTLRSGESLTFKATWGQQDLQGRRAAPGEYEIVGIFLGRAADAPGGITTPPLPFRIRP
ncbi:MAG: hypothetical protein HY334_08050 [Armatimonadetes bacterium]|nr:hypothetical protein [Armatimonadota bacterium]